jgi:hypothetical protein
VVAIAIEVVVVEVDPIVITEVHYALFILITQITHRFKSYIDNRRYNNNNSGGGYQRRPYDRPAPPEPKEDEQEDIEVRLKGLIIKIGDKVKQKLFHKNPCLLLTQCIDFF